MYNTIEIMDMGMECLVEKFGVVAAEQFIAAVKRENFDYTAWQRRYFDKQPQGSFLGSAAEYAKQNPYTGKAKRI